MKSLPAPLKIFLALAFFTVAVRGADTVGTAEVLRADQARMAAMMAGDGAALARIFADDVLFVHSDGRREGKSEYIKNMTAGDTAYADVKTSDVQVKSVTADVIVLTGAMDMRKKLGPTWSEIKLRFMSVWRKEAAGWRMVAWQSMRPAGSSVIPKQ
ncbi:MAG: nuclear transport factor 2 family protein [Opitutaceae bacterium]